MGTLTIEAALFSVQQKAPNFKFGWINPIPLAPSGTTGADALVRVSTAAIPKGAIITAATFTVVSFKTEATHTLAIQKLTAGATWSSNTTWNSKPGYDAGSKITLARTNPAAGTGWVFAGIAAWVQAAASAGKPLDFAVTAETAGTWYIHGPVGTTQRRAWVTLEYTAPAETPTSLNPADGVISVAKPVLTWDADPDIIAAQVQIDPAQNGTTPAFDSGTVATDAGMLELASTAYAGLANAASTWWRVRNQNPLGWSEWSGWQQFTRSNKPALTIVNPPTSVDDLTPEVSWTFTPQTAWAAWIYNAAGRLIAASTYQANGAHDWDPGIELVDGDECTVLVRTWDNQDRDATPGDPDYQEATKTFTVALTAGTAAVDATMTVTQDNTWEPQATITGTRAAGIPDFFVLYRRVVGTTAWTWLSRTDGTAAWQGGSTWKLFDRTPAKNVRYEYKVLVTVGSTNSAGVVSPQITVRGDGIWLYRVGTSEKVAIWGDERVDMDQPEQSIVHVPIPRDDDAPVPAIRRRLSRSLTVGNVRGLLMDTQGSGVTGAGCYAQLAEWAELDVSTRYRITVGNRSIPCIIGNIRLMEEPETLSGQYLASVSLDFWEQ